MMPRNSSFLSGSGSLGGRQRCTVLSHASNKRSKFVVMSRTVLSGDRAKSRISRCADRSAEAGGLSASAIALYMSRDSNSLSISENTRSAAIRLPTPSIGGKLSIALISLRVALSGPIASLSATVRASPRKSTSRARARETPAPQKKTTRPSSRATRSSSGMDGPSAMNLTALSPNQRLL